MERATVLIVAASPFHLELMSDLLAANDVKTIRATGAADAIAKVKLEKPSMVVLDLDLPKEESERIVRVARAQKAEVPVLAIAARANRSDLEGLLRECAGGSVEKPIDTGVFPRRVLQELRRHTETSRQALL